MEEDSGDEPSVSSGSSVSSSILTREEIIDSQNNCLYGPDELPDSPKLKHLVAKLIERISYEDMTEVLRCQKFFCNPSTYTDAATGCCTGPAPADNPDNSDSSSDVAPSTSGSTEQTVISADPNIVNAGASTSTVINVHPSTQSLYLNKRPLNALLGIPVAQPIFNKKMKTAGPRSIKGIVVEMHSDLATRCFVNKSITELKAKGVNVVITDELFDLGLIYWYTVVEPFVVSWQNGDQIALGRERCGRAVCVLAAERAAALQRGAGLARQLAAARARAACPLTVLIYTGKSAPRVRINSKSVKRPELVKKADLEMAIAELMCEDDIDAQLVHTPDELAQFMLQYSEAVAQAPVKKAKMERDDQMDFYMQGDNKNCVVVNKRGAGLKRLWEQMIAVLPMSSLEVAKAVCEEYGSPRALYEAMHTVAGVSRAASLMVSRAAMPASEKRRLGAQLANKLSVLLTSRDGHLYVGEPAE